MPLSPEGAVAQALRLKQFYATEREVLDKVRRYWKGRQRLPAVIPSGVPNEVRVLARLSRINVCDIVVESLTQSLFVDGFRAEAATEPTDPDADPVMVDVNTPGWVVWQANRMDKRQSGLHRAAVGYGTAYMVVLPGSPVPVMRPVSPRRLTAMYGEDPDWPIWALERTGKSTWRLYDDEAVYFLGQQDGRDELVWIETREHGVGVTPVVRFRDSEDLDEDDEPASERIGGVGISEVDHVAGQVAPMVALQDQIDLTTFNLLVAQNYSAFRQRYIIGWLAEDEAQKLEAAASKLWTFEDHPDEIKIGELSETTLKGYLDSREAMLKYAATLSQTPVHELVGELINLSAEALAAAEAGRERKVGERKTGLGESHEQAQQIVGTLIGEPVPDDAQVVWRDTSARSFAAIVDGLGKLAQMLQIPPQELWERIPGVTQQDIRRWKETAAQGDAFRQLADMFDAQGDEDASAGGQ